jgi:hypothetical protein
MTVQSYESCVDVMSDKLSRWITLLGISGRNTKKLVRDEMKDFLKRQIREGGETR